MANQEQINLQLLIGAKIEIIELVPYDTSRSHIQSITVKTRGGEFYKIRTAWYGDQRDGQETMIAESPKTPNILLSKIKTPLTNPVRE